MVLLRQYLDRVVEGLEAFTVLLDYPQSPVANQLEVLAYFLEHGRRFHGLLHCDEYKRFHYLKSENQVDILQLPVPPVFDSTVKV